MHLVKPTLLKIFSLLLVACGSQLSAFSQENSPYSRYGLGDLVPNQNILSRGMGGISAGYGDYQSINFVNPASLGNASITMLDVGAEADIHTLRSFNPAKKYTQTNSLFSYLQVGFPIASKKMLKKGTNWGMNFGIRPVSRIDYKIEKRERLSNIDSLYTLYEGTGGLTQAFFGTGISFNFSKEEKKIKRLNIGANFGYMFGRKDFSTKLIFINDTVDYYKSNSATTSNFGGLFFTGGVQYTASVNKDASITVGAYGTVSQKLKAKKDVVRETFQYDGNGGTYRLDSVYATTNVKGTVDYPSSLGIGFTYNGKNLLFGADFEMASWGNYKYFGQGDATKNNFTLRAGVQYFPAKENTPSKKYWSFVKYRAGLFYGNDYIQVNNNRPNYGVTFGTGMPLTSLNRLRFGEYVMLNTAVEITGRGNKNTTIKENIVRFAVGLTMNARWFQKPKYD